jgi:3-oxoacyl-[acyl-carrier protein] reductase
MDLKLAGTNVLVTGAGQGLGRNFGLGFAREGANVAFHYNSSSKGAESAAAESVAMGVKSIAVGGDLREADVVSAMVDKTEAALGPIDILINNSAFTKLQGFLESGPKDWKPQIDVTVFGTIQVTHVVAKRMAERKKGTIVNLMGDAGLVGESGLLVTAAARSHTIGLTKSLAQELGRYNIRANAVSLGLVRTDKFEEHMGKMSEDRMKKILSLYPLRRLGMPDEITPMVLLLASPVSSWTTGQVVSVNGGYA